MINIKYANAMAEVLHYLNGISIESREKIPQKFMIFLKENASKDYKCDFDYNKPLEELDLLDETKGLIGMICLNYWCETEEQKQKFIKNLNENELKYQEELQAKYNPDDIFKNSNNPSKADASSHNMKLPEKKKENFFMKIIHKIKNIFFK
jgi:hypothetical protein